MEINDIPFVLHTNSTKSHQNAPYVAQVTRRALATEDTIANRLAVKNLGLPITSPAVMRASVNAILESVLELLLEGNEVQLGGYLRFRLGISGGFEHEWSEFDVNRHELSVTVNTQKAYKLLLRQKAQVANFINTSFVPGTPRITAFHGTWGGNEKRVAPGGTFTLCGFCLFLLVSDEREGVFLIPEEKPDAEPIRLEVDQMACSVNRVVCQLPESVEKGTYTLLLKNPESIKTMCVGKIVTTRLEGVMVTDTPGDDAEEDSSDIRRRDHIRVKGLRTW